MNTGRSNTHFETYPFDWLVIGYCLLSLSLIALFGRPISTYTSEALFYASMGAMAALIVRFVDEKQNHLHAFIRLLYPALMFTFFYRITGGMMHLVFNEFFDWQVVTFEMMILGFNPTIYIDSHLLNIWVNEILSLCYFSYYLMLPAFLLPVFIKKDYQVLRQFLTATCLTFFVSYLLFSLYPVEGPRWHFASQYINALEGPVFGQIVDYVINNAAVRGGAMPSSHTGIAIVVMMFSFKHYRPFGWMLLPIVIGLAAGTVWGRFHYVSDVIPGAAIGVFSTALAWKYSDYRKSDSEERRLTQEPSGQHVS